MDKCLIFEAGHTGHRTEYVIHLMKFINNNPALHGKYVFALDEKIRDAVLTLGSGNGFSVVYRSFQKKYRHSLEMSLWRWEQLAPVLSGQPDIKEILFLELDPYLFLINLRRFRKFNLRVSGILFQPYPHFKAGAGGIRFFFGVFLKNYLSQKIVFALNARVQRCFILNDRASVGLMNKKIKDIFYFLPDPIDDDIPVVDMVTMAKTVTKYRIDKSRNVLLLFGQIDERKNLINILDALRLFPDQLRSRLSLVIAGRFKETVREKYIQHIDKYRDELSVVYNDGFVTDEEREALFQVCDLVFMPYINFYSSSGVLGHAIRHGKPVIVSATGLLREIVAEYHAGIAVDPLNIVEMQEAANQLLFAEKRPEYDSREFIEQHKPFNFSKLLLKS